MAKFSCREAHKAAVIANIEKYLGVKSSKRAKSVSFRDLLDGIYKTTLSTPDGLANRFNTNRQDARNWTKKGNEPNTKTQRRIIEFVAQAHGIV
jgi:hypothetical protein